MIKRTDTKESLAMRKLTAHDLLRLTYKQTDPEKLLAASAELRRRLDHVDRTAVNLMRRRGDTWETIGAALGMTRQAAHERYRATTDTADLL